MNIDRKRTMEAASNNTWETKTVTKRALPMPSPKFTVTYSRLCDGGAQEMSTAVCAVREVFPEASVSTHRRTSQEDVALGTPHPEVVIVEHTATASANANSRASRLVWSSKQKNLYQKYPKKRKRSIKEIRRALEALSKSYETNAPTQPQPQPPPEQGVVARVVQTIASSALPPKSLSPACVLAKANTNTVTLASATIPLPTSLEIVRPIVNEVSEDFSTAPAPAETTEDPSGCELDQNGVCRIFGSNLLR